MRLCDCDSDDDAAVVQAGAMTTPQACLHHSLDGRRTRRVLCELPPSGAPGDRRMVLTKRLQLLPDPGAVCIVVGCCVWDLEREQTQR